MSTSRSFLVLAALGISMLGGCASLPKSACQSGAWYDIGIRDGASGRTEDRFLDHAKACAKHGLPTDREQWMLGRERGLERYCTASNGVAVGEQNHRYPGVCPVGREQDFLRGYDVGRDLHQARSRLAWLDGEMHRIRTMLEPRRDEQKQDGDKPADDKRKDGEPLTDAQRIAMAYQLGLHAAERIRLGRELAQIEQVARQM